MRRIRMWGWVFAAAWVLVSAGCWPNRVAVSPGGRTMYFSLNKEGGIKTEKSSNIYALDVETGVLRQLTDGPGAKWWCAISEDGKNLLYMVMWAPGDEAVIKRLDIESGKSEPLTGLLRPHFYPWCIPGKSGHLLAIVKGQDDDPRWTLYGEDGPVRLPFAPDLKAASGNVGVARDRFAVAIHHKVEVAGDEKEAEEKTEVLVYVVDLVSPQPKEGEEPGRQRPIEAKATKAGRWFAQDGHGQIIDLALSPGGKRLVAALFGKERSQFFELDVTGKAEPTHLFDAKGYYPQWTPDGEGIVYLRTPEQDENWRDVVLWRPDAKQPVLLARLPGEMGRAYTTWRWMEDGRMRIYHLSDEGVRIVDAKPDGSEAAAKRLPGGNLGVLKRLADFGRAMEKMPDLSEGQWPPAFAEKMKIVMDYQDKHIENAPESVQRAAEEVEEAARQWEPVPAIPELPKEEAEPEPSAPRR